jgi:hypothetical protein
MIISKAGNAHPMACRASTRHSYSASCASIFVLQTYFWYVSLALQIHFSGNKTIAREIELVAVS